MRSPAALTLCLVLASAVGRANTFEELASRAAAALEAEKLPEALGLYRQALQLKPDWEEGWWFVGIISYNTQQYAEGQLAYKKLVEINPRSAPGWAFMGLCEFETGAYDAALEHLERGLGLIGNGGPPEAQQALRFHEAMLLTRQGKWDPARRIYRTLVQRGLQDPALIAGIGVNALERAMVPSKVPADQQDLVLTAGNAAYQWMAGDQAKTDAAFSALVGRFPNGPGVHYLYATYLLSGNHTAEGTAELEKELERNPQNVSADGTLALVLVLADKPVEALPHAKRAAAAHTADARMLYVYGLALNRTGETSLAIQNLEAAEKLDGDNTDVHIELAGAYSKAGRDADARRERHVAIDMARAGAHP
jgi:tetratricopeptide (TPR) repeat protein